MSRLSVYFILFFCFGIFYFLLRGLQAPKRLHEIANLGLSGISILTDRSLSDNQKETRLKFVGAGILITTLRSVFLISLATIVAFIPATILILSGKQNLEELVSISLSWPFILVSLLGLILMQVFLNKNAKKPLQNVATPYGNTDKFFHYIIFSSTKLFMLLSKIEDIFLRRRNYSQLDSPIFVTSLARAGTTPLLNALNDTGQTASHKYKDMPFLSSPVIWRFISTIFNRKVDDRERAHHDGLRINLDTPEAFEEVIWKAWHPSHYQQKIIRMWGQDDKDPKFDEFFKKHIEKIIWIRSLDQKCSQRDLRYLSKNNANISRLPLLKTYFPKCCIVVPLRRPSSHASSLLRQHMNFCEMQKTDEFILRYMNDVGHFEFGLNHKQLEFAELREFEFDLMDPNYWLLYWCRCYDYLLSHQESCIFVCQDHLRSNPNQAMSKLMKELGLKKTKSDFSHYFHREKDLVNDDLFDPELLRRANEIFSRLQTRAL